MPNTVLMKLNRNYTLRSTLGHMLTFKKNEPMPIPLSLVRACAEIGAERVDGVDPFEEKEASRPAMPIDPSHRLGDISSALIDIVERNDNADFTASGIPKTSAVSVAVGYKVDRNEVMKAWQIRSEEIAEANVA